MAPIVVANSGIFVTFDRRVMRPTPVPTPPSATAMGRPIASTEPKAKISTTIANDRPINSEDGGTNRASGAPPISILVPSIFGSMAMIRSPILPASV